jgi:hypothetical protein
MLTKSRLRTESTPPPKITTPSCALPPTVPNVINYVFNIESTKPHSIKEEAFAVLL